MNQQAAKIEAQIDALMARHDKGEDVNVELLKLEAKRNQIDPVKAILVDDRRIGR